MNALNSAKVLADMIRTPTFTPHRICFSDDFFEDSIDIRGFTKRTLRIIVQDVTEEVQAQAEVDLEAAYVGL